MIRLLTFACAALFLSVSAAEAGLVAAAVKAVSTWYAGLSFGAGLAVRIVGGIALDALGRAVQRRQQRGGIGGVEAGIATQMTLTGGSNPDAMIMGRYATGGSFVGPWVMWGPNNAWNVQVIDLSGVPLSALRRVFVNGSPISLGPDRVTVAHAGGDFGSAVTTNVIGFPALGEYEQYLYVNFFDGNQTAVDPYLLNVGAADPDFPWTDDMVGIKRSFATVSYRANRELWQGPPQCRFELGSAFFYDMRQDGSIGGAGAHRLDDPATWEPTDNPIVAACHIALGYRLPDGTVYGGGYDLADIPLASAAAAMNACDALVDDGEGGLEPAFRAGLEISFDREPAEAIDLLLQAADAEYVDVGGALFFKVGPPEPPVAFLTDDDLIVSEPETLDPFPGLQDTVNALTLTYPNPDAGWETSEAPRIVSLALEVEDGGRQLIQALDLPAAPYGAQVQRLGQAWVRDSRRFLRHVVHVPGDLGYLRPLQTIAWTSARNGYTSKLFEITERALDPRSYQAQLTLREVDPSDYDPQAYLATASISSVVTVPDPVALGNVSVEPWSVTDGEVDRRPAIRVRWAALAALSVEIEVKRAEEIVAQVTVPATQGEAIIAAGILPAVTYTVRVRPTPDGRAVAWAGPFEVTTFDIRLGIGDLIVSLQTEVQAAIDITQGNLSEVEGTIGDLRDRILGHFGDVFVPVPQFPLVDVVTETVAFVQIVADTTAQIQRNADDALERLIALGGVQFATDQRIADAGVYVDAENGTVRIAGIESLTDRAATTEIRLDAAEAEISLRATLVQVNQAISEALIDPTQIPFLDDLQAQVTSVESSLDAESARIDQIATALTVDGSYLALTDVVASLDALEGEIELRVTTEEFGGVETRLSNAETVITSLGDTASLRQTVSAQREQAAALEGLTELTIADAWGAYRDREAIRTASAFANQELLATVDENLAAEALARTTLAATVDATRATLTAESLARVTADEAQLAAITALQSVVNDPTTGVSATAAGLSSLTTRVATTETETTSQGGAITQLENRVTNAEGDIDLTAGALTSLTTRVTAAEGVNTSQGTAITGLQNTVNNPTTGVAATASALTSLTTRVTAAEGVNTSQGTAITNLQNTVNNPTTGVAATASALTSLTTRVTAAEGVNTSQGAAITNLQNTVNNPTTGVAATASALSGLTTEVNEIDGAVEALAGRADTIEAVLSTPTTGLLARVSTVEATRVTASGAVAAVTQEISADYGSLSALAEAAAFAEAGVDGITAGYVFRLNGSNVLELVSVGDGTDGDALTTARIAADYVQITGLTQIDEAVIEELAVSSALIDNLQVTNLSAIAASIGTFQSAPSGERVEISDDRIRIYDAAGQVRVKIGDLS